MDRSHEILARVARFDLFSVPKLRITTLCIKFAQDCGAVLKYRDAYRLQKEES